MKAFKKGCAMILKSKFTVILTIVLLWVAGSYVVGQAADDGKGYKAGTAYQYYLLGSQSEHLEEENSEETIVKMGSLGSGGVSGEFSYDDIVNSADEEDKEQAEQFTSIMATYSTFGYFSNKVEGFSSIVSYAGRVLSMLLLLPLALMMDTLNLLIEALLSIIAKVNVIPLLASALTDIEVTSDLAKYLGITKETISLVTSSLMTVAVIMIIISLGGMFRSRGKIDQGSYNKFKGRIFSILAMPLILGLGASLLNNIHDLATDNDDFDGNFSRYMVDSRSWAYNFNFAPNGNDGKDGDIKASNSSSYVDLDYNPYTKLGKVRIKRINSKSSLAKNGKKNVFPNTALTLSYGMSESFSAVDFINYKGTAASKNFYGHDDEESGGSFGSYYDYAMKMNGPSTDPKTKNMLGDVKHSYYPSGGFRDDKKAAKGGYKEAIDDYKDGDELIVSPQIAWRDRFIYGAKSAGENIDDYYGEPPSREQMENAVGTNGEEAFSNQSMFLILSTKFNETGGKYYIDAPARGILQMKAAFDSNRSTYFVVSMVGSPWLTIFALISKPIIQLVLTCAMIIAILSIGLIEMNLKPLMAWLKGVTLGNIEYSQALIVYSVGIAGTMLTLIAIPPLLSSGLEAISKLVLVPAKLADLEANSPQASIALKGTPEVIKALLSIAFAFIFFKSPSFRKNIIELFTMPWAWAKITGEKLEMQASGGMGKQVKAESAKITDRNNLNKAFAFPASNRPSPLSKAKSWMQNTATGIKEDLNIPSFGSKEDAAGQEKSSGSGIGRATTGVVRSVGAIAKNGIYLRALKGLQSFGGGVKGSTKINELSTHAQEKITQFHKKPTQENYEAAHETLDGLEQEAMQQQTPQTLQAPKMNMAQPSFNGADGLAKARTELINLARANKLDISEHHSDLLKKAQEPTSLDGLKDIESDSEAPYTVQKASTDARNAIEGFKSKPSQNNLLEAQNAINLLRSEVVETDYGKEEQVTQANEELQVLSESHHFISVDNPAQVLNQNAIFEGASSRLRDYQLDHHLPNAVHMTSEAAQNSMQQFQEQPSQETFLDAQSRLEALHSEILAVDSEKDEHVVRAKEELTNLSNAYHLNEN